jgi:hypothetical protein
MTRRRARTFAIAASCLALLIGGLAVVSFWRAMALSSPGPFLLAICVTRGELSVAAGGQPAQGAGTQVHLSGPVLRPGDSLIVSLRDLPEEGKWAHYLRAVDARGFVEIPQLGSLFVNALTAPQAAELARAAMRELIVNPEAEVTIDPMRTLVKGNWAFGSKPSVQMHVPLWITLLGALALAGLFFRISRRGAGACELCGYDLRGTPEACQVCPECGSARPSAA